jgi:uncharacterized protein (DUF1015 family)
MPLIRPFAGLRPVPERVEDVAAPPYDVLNSAEARERAANKPMSFLHISKAEIDLAENIDPYDPAVYAKAAENLQKMQAEGILKRDENPAFYGYRLTMGDHQQMGLMAGASVQAYNQNRIKKHEFTRPVKEDDRVRQIEALKAQTGPVFLVYKSHQEVDQFLSELSTQPPIIDVTAMDGVRHEIWLIDSPQQVDFLTTAFEGMDSLYVADGHHRSAAASRVAEKNNAESAQYFLSVIFPHQQMKILDYNRVIQDLNGLSEADFLAQVPARFNLTKSDKPVKPTQATKFGMYLAGTWYHLSLDADKIPADPVASLDVSLLANHLIEPILGISDPRTDTRIDFVGGIRGLEGLEKRVDSGEMQVAFALYPTSIEGLMSVADAGEVMPPKSTWFEPKLADGLVSHLLD